MMHMAMAIFKTLNILKFNDLHDLHINGIMYKFVNQKLPSPLLDMFEYQADDYSYNTRHIKDPKIPEGHSSKEPPI